MLESEPTTNDIEKIPPLRPISFESAGVGDSLKMLWKGGQKFATDAPMSTIVAGQGAGGLRFLALSSYFFPGLPCNQFADFACGSLPQC